MSKTGSELISDYEKVLGYSSNLFDGDDWVACDAFVRDYRLSEPKLNNNEALDFVSQPLEVDCIIINPMDKDGEFEVEMWDEHMYLSKTQAKQLIDYLTKSINAC